jgi:TatD DNase family protein
VIDTHCHLDHPRFDPDRAEVLARARAAGVQRIVVPGVYPSTWEALRASAQAEPLLAFALGIHPQVLPELDAAQDGAHLDALDAQLARGGAVAVGECGLDGGSVAAGAPMERQVAVLRAHLRLARKHGLPAMVHCLRAHPELRQLLEEDGLPEAGLVIHSYSGGPELVKIFAPLGCHFGLCGPVTYENARKPLAAARLIPPERLLLETDAPDQAPTPHRGQRCEPAFLPPIAEALAAARGVTREALVAQTTENARRLFRL